MLDALPMSSARLIAQPAPGLPVARMVVGRRVDDAAALLPRLFNLCRAAQGAAVSAALGRPANLDGVSIEILRDHLLKFHVTWPAFFGHPPRPLPTDWAEGGRVLRQTVFGPTGAAPATAADFFHYVRGGAGYAPVLAAIDGCFVGGEAVADLPPVTPATIWSPGAAENSVAARVAEHPVMRGIAAARGHGPLWRAAARLYDIEAVLSGDLPSVKVPARGEAIVPAARGTYAVRIVAENGLVTDFARVTPTDHLLAEGGVLDRSLNTLPATKAGLGALLLDILDPCSPVRLREVRNA